MFDPKFMSNKNSLLTNFKTLLTKIIGHPKQLYKNPCRKEKHISNKQKIPTYSYFLKTGEPQSAYFAEIINKMQKNITK